MYVHICFLMHTEAAVWVCAYMQIYTYNFSMDTLAIRPKCIKTGLYKQTLTCAQAYPETPPQAHTYTGMCCQTRVPLLQDTGIRGV